MITIDNEEYSSLNDKICLGDICISFKSHKMQEQKEKYSKFCVWTTLERVAIK